MPAKLLTRLLMLATLISICVSGYFVVQVYRIDLQTKAKHVDGKPNYHIVLITQEATTPFWNLIQKGADEIARDNDAMIEYIGPAQSDIHDHINLFEMAVASKVNGIITQGLSDQEFTPVIDKAVAAGIPIITIDTDASSSKRAAFVGTDNYLAGRRAATEVIRDTGGHADIGIITGSFATSNQKLRVQGFLEQLQKEPNMRVVDIQESSVLRNQATEKADKILKNHPEVNVFFGTSALDGVGIAEIVKNRGKDKVPIKIYAFDDLPETLELVKQGYIEAVFVQQPYLMGKLSMQVMLDHLKGKKTVTVYNTDVKILRQADLADAPVAGAEVIRP